MLHHIFLAHSKLTGSDFVFLVFAASLLIQLLYYSVFYARIAFKTFVAKPLPENPVPVSIIICARNEARRLEEFLPKVLAQDYPTFQVVVVNDCSEDDTATVLYLMEQEHKNLYVTTIRKDPKFSHSKKLAMVVGLKAAKYNRVLLTDADCVPSSDKWLSSMAANFEDKVEFVLGYGAYQKTGGLLNILIRFDTVFIAIQYLSFALAGLPYMGVGRNLSHRKSTFFKRGGYKRHYWIVSGTDDLFVNENAVKGNTKVELSPESFTYSEPKRTWKQWFRQKQRHFLTSPFYRKRDKVLLGTEILSRAFFYLTFTFLMSFLWNWQLVLGLFALRFILQHLVLGFAMKKLKSTELIYTIFALDFIMPLINLVIQFAGVFIKNKNTWK